jgi:hypothetical protein
MTDGLSIFLSVTRNWPEVYKFYIHSLLWYKLSPPRKRCSSEFFSAGSIKCNAQKIWLAKSSCRSCMATGMITVCTTASHLLLARQSFGPKNSRVYRCTISCFDVRPRPSVPNAMVDSLAAVNRSSPTSLTFLKSNKESFRTGGWCQTVFVFSDCILRWCAHLQKLRIEKHTVCL